MPPKGARGRGSSRGGRGRGGKASAAYATSESGEQLSQTATGDVAGNTVDSKKSAQDQIMNDASTQHSPNSSPVDIPTETPAPTPIRPDVQRESSARGRQDAARESSSIGGRGDSTVAAAASGKSKFKPKIIRRDLSEREKLKHAAENKERRDREFAERGLARAARRGARGGRGRGDAMGRGTLPGRGAGTPLGPFSEAPNDFKQPAMGGFGVFSGPAASFGGGGGGGGSGGGSGGSGSFNRIKSEGGTSTWRSNGGGLRGETGSDDFYEPNYPGEEDGVRVDIEHINLVSDDDEPVITKVNKVKGKVVQSKSGLRPVRLDRHEHKERVAIVNTDSAVPLPAADAEDNKDLLLVDQDDVVVPLGATLPDREWKGVFNDEDDVKVKVKFELDVPMALDSIPSPESKRSKDALLNDETPVSPEIKKSRSNSYSKKKKKIVKPVLQTEEDKAEYERHLEDVAILANELGGLQTATSKDANGDVNMDTGEESQVDKKEGRLYLFQFPPILPPLCHPDHAGDEVEVTGSNARGDVFLKLEGQEEVQIKSEVKDNSTPLQPDELIGEEGFIGQLIVRESGKVELSWGGTSLVVGRGVESTFLSTVVVVDERQGMDEGVAMGMGQVMGKFVVTPDFEKMI
ncbi:RNA polymerase III RPC4 [Phlyctema vagabunda]|uniref:RNA polymerase III RPC4 n=1 Tax=Phlyctema vagabunda TaxID=108571 RepID=A0ABR4PJ97_9HELO